MRDFSEPNSLGNGWQWVASFDSHDWAHHSNFYFTVKLFAPGKETREIHVTTHDWMYGDPNCKLSNETIEENVFAALQTAAHSAIAETSGDG